MRIEKYHRKDTFIWLMRDSVLEVQRERHFMIKIKCSLNLKSSAADKEIKKFFLVDDGPYQIKSIAGLNTYKLVNETEISKGVHNVHNLKYFLKPMTNIDNVSL